MTETATAPAEPDVDEAKTIPLAYLVRHDKALVIVQGVIDDTDPGDIKVAHWVLSVQSMNPLAFNTAEERITGATWDTAEQAVQAAEILAKTLSAARTQALAADDLLRDVHLPNMHKAERSPFPPGGEIVE